MSEVCARRSLDLGSSRWLIAALLGHGLVAAGAGAAAAIRIPFRAVFLAAVGVSVLIAVGSLATPNIRSALRSRTQLGAGLIPRIIVILLVCGAAVGLDTWVNPCDDPGRYFFLAEKLWHSGNLFDPFNNWRSTITGGSLYMQSLGVQIHPGNGSAALDVVSGLIILACVANAVSRRSTKWILLGFAGLVVITNSAGIPAVNSVPRFTPAFLMLAVLIELNSSARGRAETFISAAAIGGAVAACGIVRVQFLLFMGLVVLLSTSNRSRIGRTAGVTALSAMFVAPWWIASFRDTGSPLYPFFPGTTDDRFQGVRLPLGVMNDLVGRILDVRGASLVLIAVALLVVTRSKREGGSGAWAVAVAAITTWFSFTYMADSNDLADVSRYLAPMFVATVLYLVVVVLEDMNLGVERWIETGSGVAMVLTLGISSGGTGLVDLGGAVVSKLALTARTATTVNVSNPEPDQGEVRSLLSSVPSGKSILAAIDVSEDALVDDLNVYTLGIPGLSYPRPHDMNWSLGLSPESDTFEFVVDSTTLEQFKLYPLIQFGRAGAADMVGVRRVGNWLEFALEHWGQPIVFSSRFPIVPVQQARFLIDVDRGRGLVGVADEGGRTVNIGPVNGAFFDKGSGYTLGVNGLEFSTSKRSLATGNTISQVNRNADEFYGRLLSGLRDRGVEFLLVHSESRSKCLYQDAGWRRNATSPTLYQTQAPYFFAWFDFTNHLESALPTTRNGSFSLIDLRS